MSERAQRFYAGFTSVWENLESAGDEPSKAAKAFLNALAGTGDDQKLPSPFQHAVSAVHTEFDAALASDRRTAFEALESALKKGFEPTQNGVKTLWKAFFPEALHLNEKPDAQIPLLRAERTVDIRSLCDDSIEDAAAEIVFTSNVLLSPPAANGKEAQDERENPPIQGGESAEFQSLADKNISEIIRGAADASREKQLYWYDHPIPIGTDIRSDEAVYGLKGLSDAFAYEKLRAATPSSGRMTVLLSVSVTHAGLHKWAKPWLKSQMERLEENELQNLDVFAFTEEDTDRIIEILEPWLDEHVGSESLKKAFGVDGEYGRHYTFLKALPALYSILADSRKKATFKIDLDQVFPQEELTAETGKSAFEHFKTPLWGAVGTDADGRSVELGMIAGALVNEKDIAAGLFTPDIPWPSDIPEGEDLLFFKQRPMAVSTRAELMTRYGHEGSPDGLDKALHRIHVTGGTNGIRFDALRRHKPFTPSFVGRAEDQAFILSVLFGGEKSALRYVHASGFFMRHDKEAFASSAIKAGKAGSYVGDLVRIFIFSKYASFLPGGRSSVKDIVDPFTGCFITDLPATLSLLRLAFRLLTADGGSTDERSELLELAGSRLGPWILDEKRNTDSLKETFKAERIAWDAYYRALDVLEDHLAKGRDAALKASADFRNLLENCRIAG